MDLTKEQWERLGMIIENPSREGIDTITLYIHSPEDGWRINCHHSRIEDKETEFILMEDGSRSFQSEDYK